LHDSFLCHTAFLSFHFPAEAELEALNKRLNPARTRATDARTKLNELEAEERKLQGQLEGAYGADDAFVALVGRCFDAQVRGGDNCVCYAFEYRNRGAG
jgi:hypothetical protein